MWYYRRWYDGEFWLYTVGHDDPSGEWHTDSDYETQEEAADRVHYLNGGNQ